jgi:acyl-CoA synthetase (AMP-forming)/AMP-acid ligase II
MTAALDESLRATREARCVNVAAPLVEMARRMPDAPALIQPWGTAQARPAGERRWSFRHLDAESDRLARGLMRLGVRRGMRTVLMVPPSMEFYALTFALFKLGAAVVLIDPGMGVRNLGVCLGEAGPEAFIGVTKAHLARLLLRWSPGTIRLLVTAGPRLLWGGWTLRRTLREGEEGDPVLADTVGGETAAVLFTSGSTGVAKGVVYTHAVFAAQVAYLREVYGIEPGEVDLPTFPLFGLFGPALGMTAVIPEMDSTRPAHVDPRCILNAIRHYQVTNLFGSPALLRRVSFDHFAHGDSLPSLRRVISAGAPVPAEVIRQFLRLLPAAHIHTPYGATEALPVSTIRSDEILGETGALTAEGKGVCVGRPVPEMTVRIIRISDDPIPLWSDDLEVPAGTIGEIVVRGPVVTRRYHNREQSTALAKINDPARGTFWHRMGDVGYFDEQGRIWFCGRKSQRVVTPAGTLFTIPCEGVFNTHTMVNRTALVGVQRDGVTVPVLCVERYPPFSSPDGSRAPSFLPEEQVRADLLALGQKHSHTSSICNILFHPGFPVDVRHNAKIFREKLAVWAAKELARRGDRG